MVPITSILVISFHVTSIWFRGTLLQVKEKEDASCFLVCFCGLITNEFLSSFSPFGICSSERFGPQTFVSTPSRGPGASHIPRSTYWWLRNLTLRLSSVLQTPTFADADITKATHSFLLSIPHKLLNPWHPCPCQELGSHLPSPHHPSWGYNPQQLYTPTPLCSHSHPIHGHSLRLSAERLRWPPFTVWVWRELTPKSLVWSPHPRYLRKGP